MNGLPKGWEVASVLELAGANGLVTDGDWIESKDQDQDGTVRLIQLADIGDGYFVNKSNRFLNHDTAERLNCTFLLGGDVLVARMPNPLGRACVFPQIGQKSVTAVDVFVWRPDDVLHGAEPQWLMHIINSPEIREQILAQSGGTTRQRIAGGKLKALKLPTPPLAEQKRIAAKIDHLTTRTVRSQTELDCIPALLEEYKTAVLRLAFEGKIDGENTEAANFQCEGVEPLWSIPYTWQWLRCDEVGGVGLGRQRSPKNHQGPDMRSYIRSANITWQGINTTDVKEMNFDEVDFERFRLEYGDVLLNEGSGSAKEVGKPAIWRNEVPSCCFQNTVLRVQPKLVSPEYLYYYFLYTALSGRFISSAKGVNIQHIGKNGLGKYPIPVAPEEEQIKVVNFIKNAFAKLNAITTDFVAANKLLSDLNKSILSKAFSGGLVPQDPSDESAVELLARIRNQRESTPKKMKPRRTKETLMKNQPEKRLIEDSMNWPVTGLPFEEVAKRNPMPHDRMRDALFSLLATEVPKIRQAFDFDAECIHLLRVES